MALDQNNLLKELVNIERIDGYNPRLKENTTYMVSFSRGFGIGQSGPQHFYEGFCDITLTCVQTKF
jgi:hypothetical protein